MQNKIIIILLFIILAVFSTWHLSASPATWFDEGINLGIIKSLVSDGVFSLGTAPGEYVETRQFLITSNYPALLPSALSVKIFGNTILAARYPMVVFLFLFTISAYFLVKKMYGITLAIMSVALIISFTPFYGNGKNLLGEIPGLFYFLAALILLELCPKKTNREHFCGFGSEQARFFRKAKNCEASTLSSGAGRNEESKNTARVVFNRHLFFAGLFIGLSAATKPFFLIVPASVFIAEIIYGWRDLNNLCKRLFLIAAGALSPMIFWLYTILSEYSAGGLISAFGYYSNSYASQNLIELILQNIVRFFKESTPIHFTVLFSAFILFLIIKKIKKEKVQETESILFIFTIFTLIFYLKTPGWYRYFFPAHLLLFLTFPASITYILKNIEKKLVDLNSKKKLIFKVPKVITSFNYIKAAQAAIIFIFLFQLVFTFNQRYSLLYYSNDAQKISDYISNALPKDSKILIINAPSVAYLLNDFQIYQFLQINPVLYFGRNSLTENGKMYSYVVTQEDYPTLFPDLENDLKTKYTLLKNEGHYVLYKSN